MKNNFTITSEDARMRLDLFLQKAIPEITRSHMKKWILSGAVLVNDSKPKVHQFLNEGDKIKITPPDETITKQIPELKILTETDDYVVIDKPAGICTHPVNQYDTEAAVSDWFVDKYPDSKEVGNIDRPGIVHRLDKQTSGILILAKTQKFLDHIKSQFHDREIKKEYLTLVYGNLAEKEGVVKSFIGRSNKESRMASRHEQISEKDKEAITEYQVIESFDKYDYVKAMPKTGRTHQIRVHMFSLGHPVVSDALYKGKDIPKNTVKMRRHFLHAHKFSFKDLNGEVQTITSPLPSDLQKVLDSIK